MKPPSNSTKLSKLPVLIGWTMLALIIYAMVSAVVFLGSLVLLQKSSIPDIPWINSVQTYLYSNGGRNIWQAQLECVEFDEDVIYKPRLGSCRFDNVEFSTELHFSAEGRYTGSKPEGTGIAVIGDSHAMGWGVADKETFSARLQQLSGRPVYNLAVSSYGTVRELKRLEKSGLLDKVDTIIVQYCNNDLEENLQFRPISPHLGLQKFTTITHAREASVSAGKIQFLRKGYWFTFSVPFSSFRQHFFPKEQRDFTRHYVPLVTAIGQYENLKSKRILVFYSNAHGEKFRNFPSGRDGRWPNIEYVDPKLKRDDYYRIDDHLTRAGHEKVARYFLGMLEVPRS